MGPVGGKQDDDCSESEGSGDVDGARVGAKETAAQSPSAVAKKHLLSPASIRRRETVRLRPATARTPKAAPRSNPSTPSQDQTHANAVRPGPMMWAAGPYGWNHPSIGPWGPGPFPWPNASTDQQPSLPMWNLASFNGGPFNWAPQTAATQGAVVNRGNDAADTSAPALTQVSSTDGMAAPGMQHVADQPSLESTQDFLGTDGHHVADVGVTTRPLANVARGPQRDLDAQNPEPTQESAIDGAAATSTHPEASAASDDPSRESHGTTSPSMHTVAETDVVPEDLATRPPAAVGKSAPPAASPAHTYDQRQFTPDLRQLATPLTTPQEKRQHTGGTTPSRLAAGPANGVHKTAGKGHFQSMSRRRLGHFRK